MSFSQNDTIYRFGEKIGEVTVVYIPDSIKNPIAPDSLNIRAYLNKGDIFTFNEKEYLGYDNFFIEKIKESSIIYFSEEKNKNIVEERNETLASRVAWTAIFFTVFYFSIASFFLQKEKEKVLSIVLVTVVLVTVVLVTVGAIMVGIEEMSMVTTEAETVVVATAGVIASAMADKYSPKYIYWVVIVTLVMMILAYLLATPIFLILELVGIGIGYSLHYVNSLKEKLV